MCPPLLHRMCDVYDDNDIIGLLQENDALWCAPMVTACIQKRKISFAVSFTAAS